MIGNSEVAKQVGATSADAVGIRLQTEVIFLKPDEISPDPNQPRQEFDKAGLARLAESLRKYGQLQPVLVRKEQGKYLLVAGERRWRAAKLAGMARVQALNCKGGDVRSIQLVENLLREDLKPIEQAKAYDAIMKKERWSVRELAGQLSIEHSGISKALRLLELEPDIQEAVDAGKIPPTTAYEISKRPPEKQGPLARAAIEGRIKGNDLRKPNPAPEPARRPAAPVLTFGSTPRGDSWRHASGRLEVVVSGPYRNLDEVAAALEKAASAARAGKKSLAGGVGRR